MTSIHTLALLLILALTLGACGRSQDDSAARPAPQDDAQGGAARPHKGDTAEEPVEEAPREETREERKEIEEKASPKAEEKLEEEAPQEERRDLEATEQPDPGPARRPAAPTEVAPRTEPVPDKAPPSKLRKSNRKGGGIESQGEEGNKKYREEFGVE